jgi:hypothetical protein
MPVSRILLSLVPRLSGRTLSFAFQIWKIQEVLEVNTTRWSSHKTFTFADHLGVEVSNSSILFRLKD